MEFQLQSPKTVTVRPAETHEFSSIKVQRVLDDPVERKVIVWLEGFPHPIELATLSNENYDNPQWTNESVLQAVSDFISSIQ
jgi:hypothetical protein